MNNIKKDNWVFCYWDEPINLKSNKNNNAKIKNSSRGKKGSNKT